MAAYVTREDAEAWGGPYAPPSAEERAACLAPVLCLQPMTAADARYAEGRRAGLLEAAARLEEVAERLSTHGPILRMFSLAYHSEAEILQAKAGAP